MRKRPMLIAVALILATAAVLAVPEGPEDRFTGAPGDIGDCTSCHSDFPVNSGSGSVNISENTTLFTASYLPGGSYTIVVKVTQTGQKRWGFQMTALRDDNGAGAGNFVIIDPANTQKSTSGNRQYVKQTLAGSHAGTPDGPVFYDVNWTAPANGTGNVTFYAAANAANDDDFETGDYIYTTARRALADVPGPSTVFASPSDGARLEGDVTVRVQASTTIGLRDIVLKIDGSVVASGPSSPLVWVWDTRSSPNGSHVLSSTATDLAGKASSTSINVRVDNDLATPTLSVLSPAPGAKLNGTVAVVADANDDRGAPEVTFRLDGVVTQVNSTLPYVWLWNTSNARNGNHSLNVTAEDTAGHVAAREFGVVVDNKLNDSKPPEVAIVSPLPGRVEGVIVIEAHATDESGVAEAEFWHDDVLHQKNLSSGPRFVWVWETHLDANHSHLVKFKAYDIAGN
ncbi:MAG TPA: Ig-like domain-containing protein, partial [Thermoplasmata archaeon]|nr:Ig-like domain-containing protein [Thermoplasmata archaeon]